MSDDKLQLTACDYNSEAAEDFAAASAAAVAAVHNDATDPPSYIAATAAAEERIEMRVSGDQPSQSVVPATLDAMQPGLHPRPPYDNNVQRDDDDIATVNVPQQQQQQQPRRSRFEWAIRRHPYARAPEEDDDEPLINDNRCTCRMTPCRVSLVIIFVQTIIGSIAYIIWHFHSSSG